MNPVVSKTGNVNRRLLKDLERGRHRVLLVAALLSIHTGLLAWAACRQSPNPDEIPALAAGISHWRLGEFKLCRVTPPLLRLIPAVPAALYGLEVNWSPEDNTRTLRVGFDIGCEFIRMHGDRAVWLFVLGRWICIPFSLLGGYFCYRWARELYGHLAGYLDLTPSGRVIGSRIELAIEVSTKADLAVVAIPEAAIAGRCPPIYSRPRRAVVTPHLTPRNRVIGPSIEPAIEAHQHGIEVVAVAEPRLVDWEP